MKSLVIPAFLALAIHGVLFSLDLPTEKPQLLLPETRSVTVTVTAIAPEPVEEVAPLPVVESMPIAPLAPLALKKPAPKPAHRPQPKPKPKPKPAPVLDTPVVAPAPLPPEPAPETAAIDHSAKSIDSQASSHATAVTDLPASVAPASAGTGDGENQAKITTSVPLYDVNPPMGYPSQARRRNLEGTVLLRVLVDAHGRVGEIQRVRSSGHGILDRWAEKNVSQWQFKPATRNGSPIDFWVEVPVVFKLE